MKVYVFIDFLRHCEERSDAAIHVSADALHLDCRASLAMTAKGKQDIGLRGPHKVP
jgi:hypothetical protein